MGMTVGEDGQVQRMERRVTDEQPLMSRLFESLVPSWLPLWDEDALNGFRGITIVPCRSLVSSRNFGHAGSTVDLQIAHCAKRTMGQTVFQILAHWRLLQTICHRPGQRCDRSRNRLSRQKTSRSLCGGLVHVKP